MTFPVQNQIPTLSINLPSFAKVVKLPKIDEDCAIHKQTENTHLQVCVLTGFEVNNKIR